MSATSLQRGVRHRDPLDGIEAVTVVRRIREGELGVGDIARHVAARIGEDRFRAWAVVDAEWLLEQARTLEALPAPARSDLPLLGVPVGIKDAFDTVELPTTYGSAVYATHRPTRDAAVVQRLQSAGALIAGKTKCAEFSWLTPTDTLNPLDPTRTPGGSSSGSAAAVAAEQVPLATGTQTAGSTIRPASYCGVLGFKPTFGMLPREGAMPLSHTLDTVGVFARTVADLRLITSVLTGADPIEVTIRRAQPLDLDVDGKVPHLGFARTPFWDRLEAGAGEAMEGVVQTARERGIVLEDVDFGASFVALTDAQHTIQLVESTAALDSELRRCPELLSEPLREVLAEGAGIDAARYEAALADARALAAWLGELLRDYDGVLVPSAHGVPPSGLGSTGDPLFCRAFTLAGVPCVSLPLAWTAEGLPVGMQLVGAKRCDWRLLAAAEWLLERLAPPPKG